MSREIRRVAPDWVHPREQCHHSPWKGGCDEAERHGGMCFRPLFDNYAADLESFRANPADWEGRKPDRYDYMPDFGDGATAYQVYETTSEGTPISPVFKTREALISWLTMDGGGLGIGGTKMPLTVDQAERFVAAGYAPTMVFTPSTGLVSGLELPE